MLNSLVAQSIQKLVVAGAVALCAAVSTVAHAQAASPAPTLGVQTYIVSALLQLKDDHVVVKQVHAIVNASSPEKAEAMFLDGTVLRDFPNYRAIDTLISPVRAIAMPKCFNLARDI